MHKGDLPTIHLSDKSSGSIEFYFFRIITGGGDHSSCPAPVPSMCSCMLSSTSSQRYSMVPTDCLQPQSDCQLYSLHSPRIFLDPFTFSQPFKEKRISAVVRIGSTNHLSSE